MKTFKKGGVHPPDMKERTRDIPIADFPAPESVSIPMAQHFGSPAICIVGAGDKVLKGQLIGKADGRMWLTCTHRFQETFCASRRNSRRRENLAKLS